MTYYALVFVFSPFSPFSWFSSNIKVLAMPLSPFFPLKKYIVFVFFEYSCKHKSIGDAFKSFFSDVETFTHVSCHIH